MREKNEIITIKKKKTKGERKIREEAATDDCDSVSDKVFVRRVRTSVGVAKMNFRRAARVGVSLDVVCRRRSTVARQERHLLANWRDEIRNLILWFITLYSLSAVWLIALNVLATLHRSPFGKLSKFSVTLCLYLCFTSRRTCWSALRSMELIGQSSWSSLFRSSGRPLAQVTRIDHLRFSSCIPVEIVN